MFISRNKYIELSDCKKINIELEKEIKRLELALNTKERNCKVGPWCEKCAHWVTDKSVIISERARYLTFDDMYMGYPIPEEIGGEVGYCNLHIDTLCPDFLSKK